MGVGRSPEYSRLQGKEAITRCLARAIRGLQCPDLGGGGNVGAWIGAERRGNRGEQPTCGYSWSSTVSSGGDVTLPTVPETSKGRKNSFILFSGNECLKRKEVTSFYGHHPRAPLGQWLLF